MSAPPLVFVKKEGAIGFLTLNRAEKKNALSTKLRDKLEEGLQQHLKDESVRSVILSSQGDFFSAGFDLQEVMETKGAAFAHRFREFHTLLYTYPKPLVVAVRGGAFAGGLDLMLGGDFIFATPEALFSAPEVFFGLNPFISVLSRRMGWQRAYQFALTGARLTAKEAKATGLVDEVVAREDLPKKAKESARALAEIPPSSVEMLKRVLVKAPGLSLLESLELEIETHLQILQSKDFLLQVQTYFQKLKEGKR